MNDLPLGALFGALVFLLILSAFFSGSETALMTLNRYRLRHLADAGHPGAKLARQLLDKPDRLIGLILLGNNFVNILASSLDIATLLIVDALELLVVMFAIDNLRQRLADGGLEPVRRAAAAAIVTLLPPCV